MSEKSKMDCGRRRLIIATAAVGGVGAASALVPFVSSMLPSERAKAAGAPVEVDVSNLAPGQMITVEWRGKPVWIFNRSQEMLDTLTKLEQAVADPRREVGRQLQRRFNGNVIDLGGEDFFEVIGMHGGVSVRGASILTAAAPDYRAGSAQASGALPKRGAAVPEWKIRRRGRWGSRSTA